MSAGSRSRKDVPRGRLRKGRKGKPTKSERETKMEYFEIMDTNLTELAEWLDFEEDMKSNPWG